MVTMRGRRRSLHVQLAAGLAVATALGAGAVPAEAVNIATVNQAVPASGTQVQTGRLTPDGVASSCNGDLKFSPTLTGTGSQFHYLNHTFKSSLTHPICLTVTLQTACTGSNSIFSVAYVGGFDPADPLTRYAADIGSSPPATTSYSFSPGAGTSFGVVVHERTASAGCSAYTLTVDSDGPWADGIPAIAGNAPAVGATITGNDATWKGTPAIQRRWRRCDAVGANCLDIPGATGATYTVTDADLGNTLRFRNDATDVDGTSTSDSAFVEAFIPFDTRAAEALGPGDRVQNGFFVRNGVETRCGAPNAAPVILQPGNSFLYDLFPVASLLNETVCLSARTTPMCANGVTPAIYDPVFAPGSGLTTNYAGNSGSSLGAKGTVSSALPAGSSREVVVNFLSSVGSCAAYAVTLGADAPYATARPVLTGDPAEGGTLTTSDGAWSGSPAFSRSWLRCDADGAACAPIADATAASYTPTADDVGRRVRGRVTAAQGPRSVSSDSEPSGPIAAAPSQPSAPAPGGSNTAPLDRTAPRVTLRLGSRDLAKAVKSGRLPLTVTCDEACSAVVVVRITKKLARVLKLGRKATVIARAGGRAKAGKKTTLRAKLTRRARRALGTRRSLVVTAAATFADSAGNKAKQSRKGTLKRPVKRVRRG
jgi:hypothetical protein